MAAIDRLTEILDRLDLRYIWSGDDPIIRVRFSLEVWNVEALLEVRDVEDGVVSLRYYILPPFRIPHAARPRAVEMIGRINWKILYGCFEMDPDDGEVRYRNAFACREADISDDMVRHLIYLGVSAMDEYIDSLVALLDMDLPGGPASSEVH